MNATLSWRRTRKTSTPSAAGRRSTTVEAGRAGWPIDIVYIVVARFLLASGVKEARSDEANSVFLPLLALRQPELCLRAAQPGNGRYGSRLRDGHRRQVRTHVAGVGREAGH